MKKLEVLAVFSVLLFAAADCWAGHDMYGNSLPPVWLTTRTCAAESMLLVATGSIHIHAVIVETPTVNSDSYLTTYNSSAPSVGGFNVNNDTVTFTPTVVWASTASGGGLSLQSTFPKPIPYDVVLPTGVVVNKIGAACTTIEWSFTEAMSEIAGYDGSILGRTPPLYLRP